MADPGGAAGAFRALDALDDETPGLAGTTGAWVELLARWCPVRPAERGCRASRWTLVAVYERARVAAALPLRPAWGRPCRLLAGLRTLVVEEPDWRRIDPDGRSFADLDDPADLAAWDPGPR